MNRLLRLSLVLAALALPGAGQGLTRQNIATILGFENSTPGKCPTSWNCSDSNVSTDDQVFHSGKYSARIARPATASNGSYLLTAIPIDFAGKTIVLRGWVKTQSATSYAAIYTYETGAAGTTVAFATSEGLNVTGTTDWKQYSVTFPVSPDGKFLSVGFVLAGGGQAWVDDLELLVDGLPIAQAPNPPTILDTDHQFDNGSGITLTTLSDTQVKNAATLAKVWGFLKYHHPAVTSGQHQWDYDLFRILPQVLAVSDSATANAAISSWIANLGPVAACMSCAKLITSDLELSPDLNWIADQSTLGASLSQTLQNIYVNRSTAAKQFFLSLDPSIGNPSFDNELTYPALKLPDAGYQLLALFRLWNMVEYFSPNRDIMANDPSTASTYWDSVLTASIPKIALAPDSLTYRQELIRFIALINDTHANLWNGLSARPPMGTCQLPVVARFVEGSALVTQYNTQPAGAASGLLIGDAIEQLDGVAMSDLLNQWRPFYADSNDAARLRDIGQSMTAGPCGAAAVGVRRAGASVVVKTARVASSSLDPNAGTTHDLPGDTFQLLSKDVAYVKLSSVKAADSASYIQSAAGTKGLIVDIRNYPSDFVVFTLGGLLVPTSTNFVRFTEADPVNPGAFHWLPSLAVAPLQPMYNGKVVILVDEETQSQAEYTAMAFRTATGAVVLGSTTAGADGNVSAVPLPGALSSFISGLGVFYPDNRPTQRVGIVPDIQLSPTVLGVQAGRDELVDEAIRQITGASAPRPVISLVANAEGEQSTIAPNTWVEIKGTNLAPAGDSRIWQDADFANNNLPVQLDGVSVTVNGKSAYVYYVSPAQVNILTPPDPMTGPVQIVVANKGSISAPYTAQAQTIAPSFFVLSGGYLAAQHADYSLLGPASLSVPGYTLTPAKPSETVLLYANGFGPTSVALVNGSKVQGGTLSPLPVVTIGGATATVLSASLISPGLYQFNVVVPSGIADGDQAIIAAYNGATTQSGALLSVHQ